MLERMPVFGLVLPHVAHTNLHERPAIIHRVYEEPLNSEHAEMWHKEELIAEQLNTAPIMNPHQEEMQPLETLR